jgi:hypothetical protein
MQKSQVFNSRSPFRRSHLDLAYPSAKSCPFVAGRLFQDGCFCARFGAGSRNFGQFYTLSLDHKPARSILLCGQ